MHTVYHCMNIMSLWCNILQSDSQPSMVSSECFSGESVAKPSTQWARAKLVCYAFGL